MENIRFRKFVNNDCNIFFPYITDPEEQALLYPVMTHNSQQDFEKWFEYELSHAWHDYFTVTSVNGEVLGYVYTYEFNRLGGHCKICTYILPTYRTVGLGALCACELGYYLFERYPLRKVYADIYSYNQDSLQMCLEVGMIQEGVLLEYRFHNGTYADLFILSIGRQQFETMYKRVKSLASSIKGN